MHGLNPFRPKAEDARQSKEASKGFRHLFGQPASSQLFGANGLLEKIFADASAQGLMRRLSARVRRGHNRIWLDKLGPSPSGIEASEVWENPFIPSGYTYLLQLIAHDLVASNVSHSLDRGVAVIENTRHRALMLDTVYGGGPDICPSAYEYDARHRDSGGQVPRTRLRAGPKREPVSGAACCPFLDLGRGTATHTMDEGRVGAGLDWRTEAFIADPRNDSHALLSQLTVLFHLLHNKMIAALEARALQTGADKGWSAMELAYRHFLCARLAVTVIYRNILVKDVLRLILHPDIYPRYLANPAFPLEAKKGVPTVFSHGAFRFGHAMIRDTYMVNSSSPQDTIRGLLQSTARSPSSVPVSQEWLVDWSRFFEIGGKSPNLSRRIGPDYAVALQNKMLFGPVAANDGTGIAFRDYLSSCFANLPKVPELWKEFGNLLPPYTVWTGAMRAWLERFPYAPGSEPFQPGDIDLLVEDPPLPFFVQFEAAHVIDGTNFPVSTGGGGHLGRFGSLIVGEAIFGALRCYPLGFEAHGPSSNSQIGACCDAILQDQHALASVLPSREIASMPELINFLQICGDHP